MIVSAAAVILFTLCTVNCFALYTANINLYPASEVNAGTEVVVEVVVYNDNPVGYVNVDLTITTPSGGTITSSGRTPVSGIYQGYAYTFTPSETGTYTITAKYHDYDGSDLSVGPVTLKVDPVPTTVPAGRDLGRGATTLFLPSGSSTPTIAPNSQQSEGTPTPTQAPQQGSSNIVTPQPVLNGTGGYTTSTGNDTIAPVTNLTLTGVQDSNGQYTSNVICTLTAQDNAGGSGISTIFYSYDGSAWSNYTEPFTVTKAGTTNLYYKSTDNAGNKEIAQIKAITIAGAASSATPKVNGSPGPSALATTIAIIGLGGLLLVTRKTRNK